MSFTEVEFCFFLVPAVMLYWLLPRKRLVQNLFLIGLSMVFYATWSWRLFWVLAGGIVLDYACMSVMSRVAATNGVRRLAITVSLAYSLGMLGFFKYERFFAESLNHLGVGVSLPVLHLLLPLGLSFYTLQRMGLALDVYWNRRERPTSFVDYALFCMFFPQLTAGPISRGDQLLPQLSKPRQLNLEHWSEAGVHILLGLVLKAWAADTIGSRWVDPLFADPDHYNRGAHLLAVIGYPVQVFSDFAGYSLMAIGIALLFGIRLPVNFDNPFLSRSLPELWRRWHITLNRWLFDYIFTPLTTSRTWFRGRLDLALLITFLLSGLWHGAAWTFIIWGALHGLGMIAQRNWDEYYRKLCRRDRKYVALRKTNTYQGLAWLVTITFFAFTLVAFRASSFSNFLEVLRGLAITPGLERGHGLVQGGLVLVLVTCLHLLGTQRFSVVQEKFRSLPPVVRGLAYGLTVVLLMIYMPISAGAFIYQQF